MTEREYLTVKQTAELLQLSPETVKRWAQKGKLPGVKPGKAWRFKRSDVVRLLETDTKQDGKQ